MGDTQTGRDTKHFDKKFGNFLRLFSSVLWSFVISVVILDLVMVLCLFVVS